MTTRVARYNSGDKYNTPGLVYGPAAARPPTKGNMQNLASLKLTPALLAAMDAALAALEQSCANFPDLTPEDRQGLTKMGDRSEAFCRQTVNVLTQNTGVLPPSFNLAELQADLADLDALRPRLVRLQQLMEKADDTEMAIGSDIMSACLDGYAQLKVSGLGAGLDILRQQMSQRFTRKSTKKTDPTNPPANPA